jgi:hypothetical protein
MEQRPDLGYFDEGYDLASAEFYADAIASCGDAQVLPPPAYRSLAFTQLEDEAIWTRDWICIGSEAEIPDVGDLLPFTVGTHGLHVQRMTDGFAARFNKAQHGGCRVVPLQCQGGMKTRCSFTSCGYSRDRTAIAASDLGDGTPEMHQYLGLRPERLWTAHVDRFGPLLFVNLDTKPRPLAEQLGDLDHVVRVFGAEITARRANLWFEFAANWKFLAQHLAAGTMIESGEDHDWLIAATQVDAGLEAKATWVFPNLLVLETETETCVAALQPTAIGQTLCRVTIFTQPNVAVPAIDWGAEIRWRGVVAEAAHDAAVKWGTFFRPETIGQELPLQTDPQGLWGQKMLAARVRSLPQPVNDIPLYQNSKYNNPRAR